MKRVRYHVAMWLLRLTARVYPYRRAAHAQYIGSSWVMFSVDWPREAEGVCKCCASGVHWKKDPRTGNSGVVVK